MTKKSGLLDRMNLSNLFIEWDDTSNADSDDSNGSVGILVIKDGRILCGIRSGNTAPGCICGPGGHIENWETPEQAAIRETQEEFGITPKDLVPIGNGPAESDTGYSPNLFLCTDYEGEPNCTSNEMSWAQFVDLDKFANNPPSMFQPFADSIICLLNAMSLDDHEDGGPGSGHFGHEGVQGKIGGSKKSHEHLEGLSDTTKKLIDEAVKNPHGFGGVDKFARSEEIKKALKSEGVELITDDDELTTAYSPKFSYDDCVDASVAMNGFNAMSRKLYIDKCRSSGVEPMLHESPDAVSDIAKADDDGLSVYNLFNSENALSNEDIIKYRAFDEDFNPEGNEALTKSSASAMDTEDFARAEYDETASEESYISMCNGIAERIDKRFRSFMRAGHTDVSKKGSGNRWNYRDCGCFRRANGVILTENELFLVAVEDNEWSYAILLLQKEDNCDDHLLGLQKRHYQKYLAAIKEVILDMYGEVGIYTGPWTSGVERKSTNAS